jgi:hypothetical protein
MDDLPEFRVILERIEPGEVAFPNANDHLGQRTKLGGAPDWEQGEHQNPVCPECGKVMTFVAQIDSVEHDSDSNPHRVDALSDDQKWLFGDVGMIYVFFCFDCSLPHAEFECG